MFSASTGDDTVHGGDGWLDTVRLQDKDGGSPSDDSWDIDLDSGSIDEQMDNYIALSNDAAGTITFDDGSQLVFDGVERIEW